MLMMEGGLPMFIVSLEMTTLYIIKYTHKVNVFPFLSEILHENAIVSLERESPMK